jgi:hypothetical protein
MGININNVEQRFWRTDPRLGRNIYGLVSNDVHVTSPTDPIIGVMESSVLAEDVVNIHNELLKKYGRNYAERLRAAKVDDGV